MSTTSPAKGDGMSSPSSEHPGTTCQATAASAPPAAPAATAGLSIADGASGKAITELTFDNCQLRELPLDTIADNYVRQVPNAIFSRVAPTPVENPQLVAVSLPALALLEVGPDQVERPDFAAYFSGNQVLPGAQPAAHCYCGHQFGSFAGQLGDGAAMYLGEVVTTRGERVELQFKGAGKTPYSRTADGRKVLRSSIREFLCSELMAALGIPTTRAATLVTSDTMVARDMFYTGDVIEERATIITRLAPTFLRFGSWEIFKAADPMTGRAGPSANNAALRLQLTEFACRRYFPDIHAAHADGPARYFAMYREIVRRTAVLAAQWQAYGWCHGVLNTDNMSIVGVTIDYGPFGWMDRFDPEFICNTSDDQGRYSYENQPHAVRWNCIKLGEALAPTWSAPATTATLEGSEDGGGVVSSTTTTTTTTSDGGSGSGSGSGSGEAVKYKWKGVVVEVFDATYHATYDDLLRRKLGLGAGEGIGGGGVYVPNDEDRALVTSLLSLMARTGADYTNTFRGLMMVPLPDATTATEHRGGDDPALQYLLSQLSPASEMAEACKPRVPLPQLEMLRSRAQTDVRYALQLDAIESEIQRHAQYAELSKRSNEEKHADDTVAWSAWLANYSARLGKDVEHRSPSEVAAIAAARRTMMAKVNPKYVLRNWIAHRAIEKAEEGDYSEVRAVLARLQDPYGFTDDGMGVTAGVGHELDADMVASHVRAPAPGADGSAAVGGGAGKDYTCRPPAWAAGLKVSCSS